MRQVGAITKQKYKKNHIKSIKKKIIPVDEASGRNRKGPLKKIKKCFLKKIIPADEASGRNHKGPQRVQLIEGGHFHARPAAAQEDAIGCQKPEILKCQQKFSNVSRNSQMSAVILQCQP